MAKYLCIWVRAYWFSVTSFSKWLPGGHIRFYGFWMTWFRQRNPSLLWTFSFKFHVHVLCGCRQKPNDCQLCRFQNGCLIDFQWPHFLNGCLVAILDFTVSGWHGFGSVTQVCFGLSVSNFMCMSFVAVGRSLTIVSYVAFKMAALWFWTMFNCNPPIAHCHPLLWDGGILVDHWSTISSYHCARSKYAILWIQRSEKYIQ